MLVLFSVCRHWRRLGASFGGGRGRRSSTEFFFAVFPKCKIWEDGGGLTVSWKQMLAKYYHVLMLYILPLYFTLERLICAYFWLGLAKYRNQPHKY